mmetsp:Transcript_98909/g.300191  ORF Transcript_98909/g.300191 Transcript_98909/m.300191 type:complete len:236 (+) Transcript_98909:414-1121(+)
MASPSCSLKTLSPPSPLLVISRVLPSDEYSQKTQPMGSLSSMTCAQALGTSGLMLIVLPLPPPAKCVTLGPKPGRLRPSPPPAPAPPTARLLESTVPRFLAFEAAASWLWKAFIICSLATGVVRLPSLLMRSTSPASESRFAPSGPGGGLSRGSARMSPASLRHAASPSTASSSATPPASTRRSRRSLSTTWPAGRAWHRSRPEEKIVAPGVRTVVRPCSSSSAPKARSSPGRKA